MDFPHSTRRRRRERLDLTALIDVVFLLLIFFMLTAQLRRSELLDVVLPQSVRAAEREARPLVLWLGADGALALEDEVLTRGELGPALDARRAAGATGAVELRADAAVAARELLPLLESLRSGGMEALELVAERLDDEGN